jgi:hypothetical protein
MKILAMGAKLFHVEEQMYVQTDMTKLIAVICKANTPINWICDGQLRFNFWFRWGISLHQHVEDIIGPSETITTWCSGLFSVGLKGGEVIAKELHPCIKFKNVVSFTITAFPLVLV